PVVKQRRPSDAQQQSRSVSAEGRHVLDEVEECRLGPLKIVEHDDERLLASERLEQLSHSPGNLFRRSSTLGLADRIQDRIDDGAGLRLPLEKLDEPLLVAELLENF